MFNKEFGGLPWRYFFRERPAFTKDDWIYFVLIHKSGEFFSTSNRITTDLFSEQALTVEREEVIDSFINIDKDKIRIPLDSLIQFFMNHESILLPWVKTEIETATTGKLEDTDIPEYTPTRIFFTIQKYMADSLYMVSDGASNNAQDKLFDEFNKKLWSILNDEARKEILEVIEQNPYSELSNEKKSPEKAYTEPMEVYSFFVKEEILEPINEDKKLYRFSTSIDKYTPQEFKYMATLAYENGLTDRIPSPTEFSSHICKDESEELYSKDYWQKGKKEGKPITNGKKRPKFYKIHYKFKRG